MTDLPVALDWRSHSPYRHSAQLNSIGAGAGAFAESQASTRAPSALAVQWCVDGQYSMCTDTVAGLADMFVGEEREKEEGGG